MARSFESLSPREVLALAVHVERANARRFRAFANVFHGFDEAVVARFEELAEEEDEHEALLVNQFRSRFGSTIDRVEEVSVEGVIESADLDDPEVFIFDNLEPNHVYRLALRVERGAQEFYRRAIHKAGDPELKALYAELSRMEEAHAGWLEQKLAVSTTMRP
jgi:rubrerythrin